MPSDLFPADWLETIPRDPAEYDDTPLGALKSGKESEVHLLARAAHSGGTWLLAEKRFIALERRLFRNTYQYVGRWGQGNSVEARAMKKNTRFGQKVRHRRWIANEWENLVHLYEAGVTVPPPVELQDGGYLMAFIGDDGVAAPRLESVDLDRATAERVWYELVDEIARLLEAERVHGDLSAFNVLWWRDRAVLIDFSQSVEIVTHPAALDLIRRDVTSLARYFTRRGVPIDVEDVLRRIGADTHLFASQLMQSPSRPQKRAGPDARG
jgi:RIO kinase 1